MVTNQEICWGKSDGGARNGEAGISEEGGDAGEDEDGQYNLKFCGVTSHLHL